jgi:hypothetical protein
MPKAVNPRERRCAVMRPGPQPRSATASQPIVGVDRRGEDQLPAQAHDEQVSGSVRIVAGQDHRKHGRTIAEGYDSSGGPTIRPASRQHGRQQAPKGRPLIGSHKSNRRQGSARLFLMVGLPGAGKTTRASELAAAYRALRLTPDEWMICLYDGSQPDGKRDLLEGRLIALALQALQPGVLSGDLPPRRHGGPTRPDRHRQLTAPQTTFPMTRADIDKWRGRFQVPDAAEPGGGAVPSPPPGWPSWPQLAADRSRARRGWVGRARRRGQGR